MNTKRDTFLVDCKCEPTTTGRGVPYETEYHVPELDSKVYYGGKCGFKTPSLCQTQFKLYTKPA